MKPAQHRDWQGLPAGVLQHTFCRASTWQKPGSCLVAPVCRSWRSAAAGCSGIRLLYCVGHPPADQSFATWLKHNSCQLGALIISGTCSSGSDLALTALAEAAAAAQAAGRPLALHTLRLLGARPLVLTVGQLVAGLPHLRCLQLGMRLPGYIGEPMDVDEGHAANELALQALAPLQQATQLEELYLEGPFSHRASPRSRTVFLSLPANLKRLSWHPGTWPRYRERPPALQHLSQLTFVQLRAWAYSDLTNNLPTGLQQLEVYGITTGFWRWSTPEGLEAVQQAVVGLACEGGSAMVQLGTFTNISTLEMYAYNLSLSPDMCKAIAQLPNLSTLRVRGSRSFGPEEEDAQRVMPAVSAIASSSSSSLRHLHLYPGPPLMAAATGLSQWTGLTRLSVQALRTYEAEQYSWAEQLGQLPALRWLSVPHGALQAGWGWLGSLQRLRVLAVDCRAAAPAKPGGTSDTEWLEGCSPAALPPQLQVLGVSGLDSEQSAGWRVRRRLQQLLGSRGCELVLAVGVDLGEVADPAQQLAGVPVALQQVLA